jgi:hypothetical protein
MLEEITHQIFESIIGETINLKAGDVSFEVKVDAVNLLRNDSGQRRQPFFVELQADSAENHGQQMYELSHPELGVLSLFLVPIGPGEQGMRYEIVFN